MINAIPEKEKVEIKQEEKLRISYLWKLHCEKELSNGRLDTPVMGVSYTLVELNYLWLYKEVSNSI